MFALPQATTSAVRPARDGDKSTPDKVDDRRTSSLGGSSGKSSSKPSVASGTTMPSTPRTRPSDDTDICSSRVGSSTGSSSIRDRSAQLYSPQGSNSTLSPLLARQQVEEPVKKKNIFSGGFGLRSRKSSSALSRAASSETWQTTTSDQSYPRIPPPTSNVGAFFARKRAKSSPKAPGERVLHSPKSMSSLMSTDSVASIATVSPLVRSPHPPTPLRFSSTPDASRNPSLDLDEPFPGILPYDGTDRMPRLAPREGDGGSRSFNSPSTPVIRRMRSQPQVVESKWFTDENGHRIPFCISKGAVEDLERSSSPPALAKSKAAQAREWAQYCEFVKQELRKQQRNEAKEPLGAPPRDGTSKEMDAYATRKRVRTEEKIKLAARFIDRSSTCGLMLKEGWQENFPQELSVYETLSEWEKHHAKRDPQMKETVLKRLFHKVKQEFSSPNLTDPNRTPTLPTLSRKRDDESLLYDDASDRPLASSPDEEHYQVQGLGIANSSMSSFESAPRTLSSSTVLLGHASSSTAAPTVPPKSPMRYLPDLYFTSTAMPLTPAPLALARDDISGWETIVDSDIDIDDDLIEAANAAGSTPDLRQKFREQEYEDAQRTPIPPVPHISPETRQKYENATLPARPSAPSHSSVIFVRRDSSRENFSPKLNSERGQSEFAQNIHAAAQRRLDKISKVPVPAGHPALRITTNLNINPRSSSLLLHVPKTRDAEVPTPTKTKPLKPAKPPGLATHLALRKLKDEESPPLLTSFIPRPPRYGQRISPGKTLDSPQASDGVGNLNSATPLPLPHNCAPSSDIPPYDRASTIAQPDEDDYQGLKSPVDEQMDNAVAAWRGPRTPSMPVIHNYENSPSMQDAQRMRQRLGLPLLELKREGEPPHPNHKYAWDSMNLMCMGIHRGAYEPLNASPSQETFRETSPLRGFGSATPSSAVRMESYNTMNSITFNYQGKSCHACQRTCCYYAEQLAIMKMAFVQNPSVRAAVERARRHEQDLRTHFPGGVERHDAHMKCSDCGAVCCFEHGVVCQTLSCRAALYDGCEQDLHGRCRVHGDRVADAIALQGMRMDRAVQRFQDLRDLQDGEAVEQLLGGL